MKKIIVLLAVFATLVLVRNSSAQQMVFPPYEHNGFQIDSPIQPRELNSLELQTMLSKLKKTDFKILSLPKRIDAGGDPGIIWRSEIWNCDPGILLKSNNWNCDPKMLIQTDKNEPMRIWRFNSSSNPNNLRYHLSPLYLNPPEKLRIDR